MKNKIYIFAIVLICLLALAIVCILGKKDTKNNTKLSVSENNVVCVRINEETEGGYIYYKTTDTSLIKEIADALQDIEIGEKVDYSFSDSDKTYILELEDGTNETYCFQNGYYNKDGVNYKVEGYKKLQNIKVPKDIK